MVEALNGPKWLADYLGVPRSTVYQMTSKGTGPKRIRVGKHVRYRMADVDAWLAEHEVDGTPAA